MTFTTQCDYCQASVKFELAYISENSSFTKLIPASHGSGSDHLATWCASCGPQHRRNHGPDVIAHSGAMLP